MSRIPRDVDDLMWVLAEQGDERAEEEFNHRYPEYRTELIKRKSMVQTFKGAAKTNPKEDFIPSFKPKPVTYRPPTPRWIPVLVGVVLIVAAFASYKITQGVVNKTEPPHYVVDDQTLKPSVDDPQIRIPQPDPINVPPQRNPSNEPTTPSKLISIKIERAPLISVIDMIAQQSGIQVELAPKMENPDIKLEYVNVSGMSILNDLGKQFGFTALEEGHGKVLLVPVVDPKHIGEKSTPLGIAELVEDDGPPAKPKSSSHPKTNAP